MASQLHPLEKRALEHKKSSSSSIHQEAEDNSSTPRSVERDESPVVDEVFSMFKTYLESKLDETD